MTDQALTLLKRCREVLDSWEQWEADIIIDSGCWGGGVALYPTITAKHYDRLVPDLQMERKKIRDEVRAYLAGLEGPLNLLPFRAVQPHHRFPGTQHVLYRGGFAHATDGRIIVRVPSAEPDSEPMKWPNPKTILPSEIVLAEADKWEPWPAIDRVMKEDECGACGDDRIVADRSSPACECADGCGLCKDTGYSALRICPFCVGLGDEAPKPHSQRVGKAAVALIFDELVRSLPGVRYRPSKDGGQSIIWLRFDGGGIGAVVPLPEDKR